VRRYTTAGFNAGLLCTAVVLAYLLAALIAYRGADVPEEVVACTGQVEASLALKGDRVAAGLGGVLHQLQQGIDANSAKRDVEGTFRVAGTWLATLHNTALGGPLPPEAQRYETDYQQRQARQTDGCAPCPTVAGTAAEQGIPVTGGSYSDPVAGAVVGTGFGARGSWARYHTGIDFRAAAGTPELAVRAGTVEHAGRGPASSWAGNYVVLRFADGWAALYAHQSRTDVHDGQTVKAGDRVGLAGQTGRAFGAHLHFETYPPSAPKPIGPNPYAAVNPGPKLKEWKRSAGTNPAPAGTEPTAAVGASLSLHGGSGFDAEQRSIAATALAVARTRSLPDRAVEIILAAGLVESGIHARRYATEGTGDRDWLQQRGSWGSEAQRANPEYAAGKFYDALVRVNGWQSRDPGSVAQAVQVSAFPGRYSTRMPEARRLLASLNSSAPGRGPKPAPPGRAKGQPVPPAKGQPVPPATGEVPAVPTPQACTNTEVTAPSNYTAGSTRTVTDPTSNITYKVPIPDGKAGVAVNFALDQLGDPYKFGSPGPDSWDCASLVSAAWKAAGEQVTPQADWMAKEEPRAVGASRGGDLLYQPGHVQMFLMTLPSGKDLIVEAPRPGKDVLMRTQWMQPTARFRPDQAAS
jgi:murein DD-endopeptidase MepM/ murein hydrolase activator NlpD